MNADDVVMTEKDWEWIKGRLLSCPQLCKEIKRQADLIESQQSRIAQLETENGWLEADNLHLIAELDRIHNMLSAVSSMPTNVATFSDFVHASLEDGAKKKQDDNEPYTAERPYCD